MSASGQGHGAACNSIKNIITKPTLIAEISTTDSVETRALAVGMENPQVDA